MTLKVRLLQHLIFNQKVQTCLQKFCTVTTDAVFCKCSVLHVQTTEWCCDPDCALCFSHCLFFILRQKVCHSCLSAGLLELLFSNFPRLDGTLGVSGNRSFVTFSFAFMCCRSWAVWRNWFRRDCFYCLRDFAVQSVFFPFNTSLRTSVDLY